MDERKLKRIQAIIDAANVDLPSTEDVAKLIASIISETRIAIASAKADASAKAAVCMAECEAICSRIDDMSARMGRSDADHSGNIRSVTSAIASEVARIEGIIDGIEDFDPSDIEASIDVLRKAISSWRHQTPTEMLSAIRSLPEGDGLNVSDIDGFEEALSKLAKSGGNEVRLVGGTNGIQLYVDGVKKGNVKYINLVAGSGITLTHTGAQGRNDVTISAAAGGIPETPTGSVNGTNVTYTFTRAPKVIVVDQLRTITSGGGFTLDGTGLIATLDIAPNFSIISI